MFTFFPFSGSVELLWRLPSLLNEQKQSLALLAVLEFSVLLFQKKSQALRFNTFKNWDRKDSEEKFGRIGLTNIPWKISDIKKSKLYQRALLSKYTCFPSSTAFVVCQSYLSNSTSETKVKNNIGQYLPT